MLLAVHFQAQKLFPDNADCLDSPGLPKFFPHHLPHPSLSHSLTPTLSLSVSLSLYLSISIYLSIYLSEKALKQREVESKVIKISFAVKTVTLQMEWSLTLLTFSFHRYRSVEKIKLVLKAKY